jgi:hypothetical protein
MGESMIVRLDNSIQLQEILCGNHEIIGDDWIANMVKVYESKLTKTDFRRGGEKSYLFCGQEEKGKAQAQEFLDSKPDAVAAYITSRLKNELDKECSTLYPEEYEERVLLKRKQELDVQKQEEFAERIRELEAAGIPLFESIEIETVNRCNGTCGFCPINHRDDRRPYAKMSEELFHKIIDELEALDYAGRISLFSNNEPLLDNRICEFAKYASDRLKKACIIIFTNGTLMNYETFVTLIEHVDVLNFDIYYDNSSVEETPAEVKKILAACLTEKRWKEKVMVQFIPRNMIRNNRGGNSKNRKKSYEVQAPCLLPYIQMIVRPDGKTSLCCNDAMGQNTLADLNTETLTEAWYNSNYAGARNRIRTSRQNIGFCKYCDNYAGLNTKGKTLFSEEARTEVWTKIEREFV